MNKRLHPGLAIAVIVILSAIIGIGTWLYSAEHKEILPASNPVAMQPETQQKKETVTQEAEMPLPAVAQEPAEVSTEGWKTYRNEKYGFEFKYPGDWKRRVDQGDFETPDTEDIGSFVSQSGVAVLSVDLLKTNHEINIDSYAQTDIIENNCKADNPDESDRIIENKQNGILYVLYCSATTENYIYLFKNLEMKAIKVTYHDDFNDQWNEKHKVAKLERIINTMHLIQ